MSQLLENLPAEAKAKLEKKEQPSWVSPMLATLTDERFSREGWIFEPKFDGERCLAFKRGNEIKLWRRACSLDKAENKLIELKKTL